MDDSDLIVRETNDGLEWSQWAVTDARMGRTACDVGEDLADIPWVLQRIEREKFFLNDDPEGVLPLRNTTLRGTLRF
jgi:hypothetical protein